MLGCRGQLRFMKLTLSIKPVSVLLAGFLLLGGCVKNCANSVDKV